MSSSSPISNSSPTRASTPPPTSSFSDEMNILPLEEATQQCAFNTLSQMSSSSSSSMTHAYFDPQRTFKTGTLHKDFSEFPNKQTFAETIQRLWDIKGNDYPTISFLIPFDTAKYVFKIEENGKEQPKLSGLRISGEEICELPLCNLSTVRLGSSTEINDIIAYLTPLFTEENRSEDNFYRALHASLFALPDDHFKLDYSEDVVNFLSNTETIGGFESFPNSELFGKRLRTLWTMSQGEEACIFFRSNIETIGGFEAFPTGEWFGKGLRTLWKMTPGEEACFFFRTVSNKFYFKFSKKTGDRLHCGILCASKSAYLSTEFESIETAIRFFEKLLPPPSDSEDTVKRKEREFDATSLLQVFIKLHNAQILPMMLSLATLYEMSDAVQSEDPKVLGHAFEQLQKLTLPTVLRIGSENRTTTVGALVLFSLTIIQSNTTPEVIKDVPLYPGKAFLKIDGCSSTPKQRRSAVDYAVLQLTLDSLEWALGYKGPNIEMHDDLLHLASLQFDVSKGTEQNLEALAQKRQEIRDQLGLG